MTADVFGPAEAANSTALVATAWSLYLPGVQLGTTLDARGEWASQDAPPPEKASAVLGRKGLLYKEPATRLALCAVHRAFGLPAGGRPGWPLAPRTAVVACSNLGNVETVAKVTRTVATEGGQAVSVLDAPNASSNIVASTVALWFGFGGPNLMVCSGATAGMDGLKLAWLLLAARRAERVILVGAEPADEVASALHASSPDAPPLRAGAACVVLERAAPGSAPGAPVQLVDPTAPWPQQPRTTIGPDGFDPARHWGDCYGAQGVLALALATHLAVDEGHAAVGVRRPGEPGALITAGRPS